ncbi:thioesterase family protein [Dongia rigui]|uniref:Thioesterase family protein n=1 Tax=Dongia rigui TaxID=940149 RepID=A0ABU5DXN8_9PROT|nr:thioesterase family protein [Dongia rigui]MDY0872040.1 thioesterase family protein [Dongia rigui]
MKDTLKVGATHRFSFTVTDAKTVPQLYPESPDFCAMPAVFATGFMVGLMEWACVDAMKPHLDDGEGSLGVGINVNHVAATPPGMMVTVYVTCIKLDGRRVSFHVRAEDEVELIGEGTHDRAIVRWDRFTPKIKEKAAKIRR